MDNVKRIEDKIDKVLDKQNSMDITLAKQSVILEEHVKRTNLLEAKIVPIEKHVAMVHGALKFLGFVALFVGIIEGLLKIIGV